MSAKSVKFAGMLFVVCSTAAHGEMVRVRSGEHGGFTRLVLEFDTRPNWTAGRTTDGYGIAFDTTTTFDVDLADTFRLITRERIAEIDRFENGNGLEILLGCECVAEIRDYRDNSIIFDVREGSAGSIHFYEGLFVDPSSQPRADISLNAGFDAPSVEMFTIKLPKQFQNPERTAKTPKALGTPEELHQFARPDYSFIMSAGDLRTPLMQSVPQAGLTSLLSKEFSRAVSQGLISPNASAEHVTGEALPPRKAASVKNLNVVTGIDRDTGQKRNAEPTHAGQTCVIDSAVDVVSWGDPNDDRLLGKMRTDALAEDGTMTQIGILNLARYYVMLGFGAEAESLAAQLDSPPDAALLTTLAEIVDYGEASTDHLSGQLGCDGSIALWAALARPFPTEDAPDDSSAILRAFAALPRHLRSHLGPFLSERFRNAGLSTEARTVLNIASRGDDGSHTHDLIAARLGLESTGADDARNALADLATNTDVTAAEALLELLNDAIENGRVPEASWVDDAPSLIRATRGTPAAADLNVARLFSELTLQRFEEVRLDLQKDAPGVTPVLKLEISRRAVLGATRDGDDATFLRTEIGYQALVGIDYLTSMERLEISQRLSDIGLHERALMYLPEDAEETGDRIVSAGVLARAGRFNEGLEIVADLDGEDVDRLRAEALERADRPMEAAEVYSKLKATSHATTLAAQVANWDWIANHTESEVAADLSLLIDDAESQRENMPDATNTRLLSQTEDRRLAALRLLSETEVDRQLRAFTD